MVSTQPENSACLCMFITRDMTVTTTAVSKLLYSTCQDINIYSDQLNLFCTCEHRHPLFTTTVCIRDDRLISTESYTSGEKKGENLKSCRESNNTGGINKISDSVGCYRIFIVICIEMHNSFWGLSLVTLAAVQDSGHKNFTAIHTVSFLNLHT